MGYHMQDTAELFFEDCRVPASHLLGEEGNGGVSHLQDLSGCEGAFNFRGYQ